MSYAFLYGEKPCVSRNFNNRFQFWNVSLGFGGLSALECNTKNQKKRDRRETVPPIHPRYGNLCKEQDEGGEEAGGSFYMRLVICILCFIFFVYMDQNHAEVANVNSTKIINEIERDVELEAVKEVWENFE